MILDEYQLQQNIDCRYYVPNEFNPVFAQKEQSQCLSFLHCNSRSLSKSFDNFNVLLSSFKFDCSIIGISETWLNANSPPLFLIEGYQLVRKDRQNGRGGGVLFYVSDKISFKIREDLSFQSQSAELLCIEIDLSSDKNFIVCVMYRPPHTDIDTFLTDFDLLLAAINNSDKSVCIMGDFNVDLLAENVNTLRFQNILDSNAFHAMIDKPTRISDHSSTLLDNIFVKTSKGYSQSGLFYSEISDHLPVFCMLYDIHFNRLAEKKNVEKRKFTEGNIASLNDAYLSESWSDVLECSDVERAFELFSMKFSHHFDRIIPFVKISN